VIEDADRDGESLGLELSPGARHYRAYVGWPVNFDLVAAMTFNLLTTIGLRQHHTLLDVGCGSLRSGRVHSHAAHLLRCGGPLARLLGLLGAVVEPGDRA
jgi:hypothetical protein